MATRAYILIEASVGKTREVATALKTAPEIRTVDIVTGPYDLVVVVEAEDLNAVGRVVTSRIHAVNGVMRTVTCLAV